MSCSGLQDTQTASLWLPGSTPSATKTLFGGGIDVYRRFCHASPHEIAAPNRFRHVFGPCGSMPTGGCRKAISYQCGLYLAKVKLRAQEIIERGGFLEAIGADRLFTSKEAALQGICRELSREVCANCPLEIFRECKSRA